MVVTGCGYVPAGVAGTVLVGWVVVGWGGGCAGSLVVVVGSWPLVWLAGAVGPGPLVWLAGAWAEGGT